MPERELPGQTALTFYLTSRHQRHQLVEFVSRKIGADVAETLGDVFPQCLLSERMDIGKAGVAEGVLF